MSLRFYDTARAEVRPFEPLEAGRASLYYCGATVQGMPHVGHVRSAIVFDQLTRWLEASGLRVTVVRNVTDIDDKILEKSRASFEDGAPADPAVVPAEEWWALAYRFEQEFSRAYSALGVRPPTYEPRATGHIPEMHALIQRLVDRGHAYPAPDGSGDVYFDVRSWSAYGSLTHQGLDDMQAAPDADPRGKRDPRDFALWKGSKDTDPATASWDSPWGAGRPGWHLECSSMVTKYLGAEFDIHGGGLDLRFPHHENEMAQSQAAGHAFARFWMHNGMVTYGGEKMSKSLGNTVGPQEMIDAAGARVVRYYLGQAHYRSVLDYRGTSLQEAAAAVARIDGFIAKATARVGPPVRDAARVAALPPDFTAAMDDDLNVPQALAVLHTTVRSANIALAAGNDDAVASGLAAVVAMTGVLGLDDAGAPSGAAADAAGSDALAALVADRIAERGEARAARDWARADAIRDGLAAAGITLEDSAEGASWSLTAG
ncbi:cysteine--tRNA ligase [Arthrobacter echini]|uniref:Cysteine--tRNA ligase n=1 Tax=Arthrobacter echini TaxID=1529066 RepID=A0A5D0XP03_9MICC|nr:cysteine--tRNA ligase [Arthrobacter echini]TYC98334.1 cysteine--tRNA ligase [Arthrobacter echini]